MSNGFMVLYDNDGTMTELGFYPTQFDAVSAMNAFAAENPDVDDIEVQRVVWETCVTYLRPCPKCSAKCVLEPHGYFQGGECLPYVHCWGEGCDYLVEDDYEEHCALRHNRLCREGKAV